MKPDKLVYVFGLVQPTKGFERVGQTVQGKRFVNVFRHNAQVHRVRQDCARLW